MNSWGAFAAAMVCVAFAPMLILGLGRAASAQPPAAPEREDVGEGT